MTLNRAWLIGTIVATSRPVTDDLGEGLVALLAVFDRRHGAMDRFRIRTLDGDLPAVGGELLVEGSLVYAEHRPVILVGRMVVLTGPASTPVTSPTRSPQQGTHARPAPHHRAGYFRRLGAGTPRERLVWVRPTRVGGPE